MHETRLVYFSNESRPLCWKQWGFLQKSKLGMLRSSGKPIDRVSGTVLWGWWQGQLWYSVRSLAQGPICESLAVQKELSFYFYLLIKKNQSGYKCGMIDSCTGSFNSLILTNTVKAPPPFLHFSFISSLLKRCADAAAFLPVRVNYGSVYVGVCVYIVYYIFFLNVIKVLRLLSMLNFFFKFVLLQHTWL